MSSTRSSAKELGNDDRIAGTKQSLGLNEIKGNERVNDVFPVLSTSVTRRSFTPDAFFKVTNNVLFGLIL